MRTVIRYLISSKSSESSKSFKGPNKVKYDSRYWLALLNVVRPSDWKDEVDRLLREADELRSILGAKLQESKNVSVCK